MFIIRDQNLRDQNLYSFGGPGYPSQVFYPCRIFHEALCNYIIKLVPKAIIHSVGHDNISEDFARMMYAPTLFKGVSTFSFWAAYSSFGEVYTTPFGAGLPYDVPPHLPSVDMGPQFHWVNSPVMVGAIWLHFHHLN